MSNRIKVITNNVFKQLGQLIQVHPEKMRLNRFLDNSVMLFNHIQNEIIGSWDTNSIIQNSEYIEMQPVFSSTAKDKETLYNENHLKAASISFAFEDGDWYTDENDIMHIVGGDILEVSLVSIPADGKAIKNKFYYKDKKIKSFSMFKNENITDTEEIVDEVEKTDTVTEVEEVMQFSNSEKVEEIEPEIIEEVVEVVENEEIIQFKLQISELEQKLNEKSLELSNALTKIEEFEKVEKAQAELKLKADFDEVFKMALEDGKVKEEKRELFFSLGIEKTKEIFDSIPSSKRKPITESNVVNFLKQNLDSENVSLSYADYLKKGKKGLEELSKLNKSNPDLFLKLQEEYQVSLKK